MAEDKGRREMLAMFHDGKGSSDFSDFTIVVENSEFPVHKSILDSRSSYFRALFDSNLSECENNRLTLDDIEVDVFQKLLKYVYTSELDVEYAVKLIVPGDKYGLEDLVDLCENHLLQNMKRDIAPRCFLIGNLLGKEKLKEEAFLSMAGDWGKTFSTDGWNEVVTNHSLMTEIERIECTKPKKPPGLLYEIYRNEALGDGDPGVLEWCVGIQENCTKHSPTFTLLEDDHSSWRLWVTFGSYMNTESPSFQCYLYLSHIGPPLTTPVKCYYSIHIDTYNLPEAAVDTTCCFSQNFRCSTLLSHFSVNRFDCSMIVELKPIIPKLSPRGFIDYLDQERFTDAIVNVGGETFPCHRVALATASPFFYDALKNKTELQLNEMKPETFKHLLLLIHRRQLPEDVNFDLLSAVKRFKLDDEWLNRCRALVFRNMNDKHLMDFLIESHAQQDPIQKKMAFKQIANKFEAIVESPDWHQMGEHEGLHYEFFKFLIEKSRPNSLR